MVGEKGSQHGFMAGDGDTHGRPDSEISAKMGEVRCGQSEPISADDDDEAPGEAVPPGRGTTRE
jgi:hypothetical protein